MVTDPYSEPICSLLSIRWKMSGWPFVCVSVSCVTLVIYFVFLILSVVSQSIGVFMMKELTFCLSWISINSPGLFGFLFLKKWFCYVINEFIFLVLKWLLLMYIKAMNFCRWIVFLPTLHNTQILLFTQLLLLFFKIKNYVI